MSALPPLPWLRTFEAAARHRSFAAAARELGLTATAVSQQMRALETRFGVDLFERLPRGVTPTAAGAAYLPAVRAALDGLATATAGLFGAAGPRRVAIRSAASFAALVLAPRLGAFRAQHPDIRIDLYTTVWSDALRDDRIDLEIRYGEGGWAEAEAHPLSPAISLPVCLPGVDLSGPPQAAMARVMAGGLIHIAGCENLWTAMARRLDLPDPAPGGWRVDNSTVALALVAEGCGAAMISEELAAPALADGRVAAPSDVALPHGARHYVLVPRRARAPNTDALLLRDWLIESCRNGGG
jgi:LysR family glycine cleavage system transcriptional activator